MSFRREVVLHTGARSPQRPKKDNVPRHLWLHRTLNVFSRPCITIPRSRDGKIIDVRNCRILGAGYRANDPALRKPQANLMALLALPPA